MNIYKIDLNSEKIELIILLISTITLILSFLNINIAHFDLAWISIILCGIPIIKDAIIALITEYDIKADLLVSIALVASILIGEIFAAGEIAVIMTIGAMLEKYTVQKSRNGIEKLVDLTPQKARLIKNTNEKEILAKDINIGDIIKILPGEAVPVDGVIIQGETSIDQSVITGEPVPFDKKLGDEVFSGTINQFGSILIKAIKSGKNSSFQRMVKLIESVNVEKTKIVRLTDKWATWIVIIALSSSIITYFITGEIIRSVTILVVFCPCALVLATPTAIVAANGNLTKRGILIKEGDALERLSFIDKIMFDKTGTLTRGKPEVIEIIPKNCNKETLMQYLASVENMSEHPLGKTIVNYYKKQKSNKLLNSKNFKMEISKGVKGEVNNKIILAGNKDFLKENNIKIDENFIKQSKKYLSKGFILIYVGIENEFSGLVILNDVLREDSKNLIQSLKNIRLKTILATGDNEKAAKYISNKLKIDELHYNCLPETKKNIIHEYQAKDEKLAMVGDGLNDAASLKESFVGIAMGKIGNDITINVADIVLINDNIQSIIHLLKLSKKVMKTININIIISLTLNFIAIILAILAILNPITGALVHNIGSILVIIYSTTLLNWSS